MVMYRHRVVDPAFQRAILKIALELRKPGARGYEAVIGETIAAMRLDGMAFRRYLGQTAGPGLLLCASRRLEA